MQEEKELTRIERELVLQYLRDDNVPLTVTLEEKPEQAEASLVDSKTDVPGKEKRVPASAVFPVAIPSSQIDVLKQGIILLKNPARTVQPFLGKQVRVQFYFNHLGLYFITEMKEFSQGLAIVVPSSIKRIPDVVTSSEYDFSGTVSFKTEKSTVSIDCIPLNNYQIFVSPKWADIPEASQHEAKALLEKFVADAKSGEGLPLETVSIFWLLPDILLKKTFLPLNLLKEGLCLSTSFLLMIKELSLQVERELKNLFVVQNTI